MNNTMSNTSGIHPRLGFVLIAGAGLEAWVWRDVVRQLSLPSLAISFPTTEAKKSMNLEDYTRIALEQIKTWDGADQYIIVGHSIGAIITLELTKSLGGRVAGIAAVGSIIPKREQSFFSALPFPQNILLPLVTKLVGTKPPKNALKKAYCNDLSETQTAEVIQHFSPESYALYTDPLTAELPDTPRLYVTLSKDENTPPSLQKVMATNFRATETISLDAGHLAMLAQPEELAQIVNDFAAPLR